MFKDWKINKFFKISFIESKEKGQIETLFFMETDILILNFILKNKHSRIARKTIEKKIYRDRKLYKH